jgi:hypothetical protein
MVSDWIVFGFRALVMAKRKLKLATNTKTTNYVVKVSILIDVLDVE